MDNISVSTSDLKIGYKGNKTTEVAGPINIQLNTGKLYGLIGTNGIGKSTLIRTLSGLIPPLHGKVEVESNDFFNLNPKQRARMISIVLTEPINGNSMTIYELVKMGRYPYTNWQFAIGPKDQESIANAIKSVGLTEKQEMLVNELSDGNRQKAMIARALAQDSPVMVLDEPTAHLDVKNRFIILDLLKKLTKEHHKTIIFSGHDLEYMLRFCDELILMTSDSIIIDSPKQLAKSGALHNAFDLMSIDFNVDVLSGYFQ